VPFTLAHPAAVLPLARGRLVPAALVAGALSPDVPYFLPVPRSAGAWYEPFANATTTHAWPGALTVAVPTALVLLGLWAVVRAPLRALALPDEPGGWRRPALPDTARALPWVLASAALGVLTHVVWDAFTHGDGLAVQHVAWLRAPLVGDVPAARVLQHASTALGLAVLGVRAVRGVRAWRAGGGRVALDGRRVAVVAAVATVGVVGAVAGTGGVTGPEALLSAAAKSGGTACAAAGLLAAVLWWLARPAAARAAVPTARG